MSLSGTSGVLRDTVEKSILQCAGPPPKKTKKSKVNVGAIAGGIGGAALLAIVGVALCAFFVFRKRAAGKKRAAAAPLQLDLPPTARVRTPPFCRRGCCLG